MRGNFAKFSHGVHGILLCQTESADAVRAFVESCRYPINKIGTENDPDADSRPWLADREKWVQADSQPWLADRGKWVQNVFGHGQPRRGIRIPGRNDMGRQPG